MLPNNSRKFFRNTLNCMKPNIYYLSVFSRRDFMKNVLNICFKLLKKIQLLKKIFIFWLLSHIKNQNNRTKPLKYLTQLLSIFHIILLLIFIEEKCSLKIKKEKIMKKQKKILKKLYKLILIMDLALLEELIALDFQANLNLLLNSIQKLKI